MNRKPFKELPGFSKIKFEPERQFHVLKHFVSIEENYRKELVLTGVYTGADIDKRLVMTGSKFLPGFADTPPGVMKKIRSDRGFKMVSIRKDNDRMEVEILFPGSEYPGGIGLDCLLSFDQVKNRRKMYRMENDHFPLWCIKGSPVPTWTLNLVLFKTGGELHVSTCFPGKYAPPLPDKEEQSGELYRECVAFWENHVFIEPGNLLM